MTPFKSIMVATDFSAPANNAVRRAALMAKQHGAHLAVVHVVTPPSRVHIPGWSAPALSVQQKVADARDRLHDLAAKLTQHYQVTPSLALRSGNVLEALHRAAARADLLVMGQWRKNALAEMLLGSTAQRLVACSKRPVLVVKQAAESSYRRALVPIDFSPASDAAAFVAAALAPGIDLQVFHALDSARVGGRHEADVMQTVIRESIAKNEDAVLARMRRSMSRLGLDSGKLRFALGRGSPVQAILRQAQSLDADVLVATKQQRGRMATSVLGNISSLLARSCCDMLIVSGWVRDPRESGTVSAQRPRPSATAVNHTRPDPAHATLGFSWMRAQLPAEAFMATEHGRPHRAGG